MTPVDDFVDALPSRRDRLEEFVRAAVQAQDRAALAAILALLPKDAVGIVTCDGVAFVNEKWDASVLKWQCQRVMPMGVGLIERWA